MPSFFFFCRKLQNGHREVLLSRDRAVYADIIGRQADTLQTRLSLGSLQVSLGRFINMPFFPVSQWAFGACHELNGLRLVSLGQFRTYLT